MAEETSTKMSEICAIKLIKAIQFRPALYNKEDSMYYSHRKFKHKLWKEVCEEVYGNWDLLKPHRKLEHARELQKRWKSLRTCFTRELNLQRKENLQTRTTSVPMKKRKKYEYFNMLRFLLNPKVREVYEVADNEEPKQTLDPLEASESNIKTEDESYNYREPEMAQNSEPKIMAEMQVDDGFASNTFEYARAEPLDKIPDVVQGRSEEDEDRQFLLSLVSSFKRLDEKKKFEARIGILKLLQEIKFPNEA